MENKVHGKKTRGAWMITVKGASTGQGADAGCSPACSEGISYSDRQENTADGKEDE